MPGHFRWNLPTLRSVTRGDHTRYRAEVIIHADFDQVQILIQLAGLNDSIPSPDKHAGDIEIQGALGGDLLRGHFDVVVVCRVSDGDQVSRVAALAMKRGRSVDFTGYWPRHIAE